MELRILDNLLKKIQKPSRYTGGEFGQVNKNIKDVEIRFCFCFPDLYEIGMSHLGMKILYGLINERTDAYCERCFCVAQDFQKELKENNLSLFSLETKTPLADFDILGFTLQYELSYTNILNMLYMSDIPLYSSERGDNCPIIIAGGPCAVNAEPIADFIDLFVIGEGEEPTNKLLDLYRQHKKNLNKKEFLRKACAIEGVYVPSLYDVEYNNDGTVKKTEIPQKVQKAIIKDIDNAYYPDNLVVPFNQIVHDRVMLEVFRGCIRGCRFCQAGMIYRPYREKNSETLCRQAKGLCEKTGYEEMSLASLSTSDYKQLMPLLGDLYEWCDEYKVNLSLPSLRIDNFSDELLKKITRVKKSGLTFAPEAATQRLRDVINKNVVETDITDTVNIAFSAGYTIVKLYFMMGLPTESLEDVKAIADLSQKIVELYYKNPNKRGGKGVEVHVSVSTFVPKPFTPFQWEGQDSQELINRKQKLLKDSITSKKIKLSYHDKKTSHLEAALARGDRRLSKVIYTAFKKGCIMDSWSEFFKYDVWLEAFKENDIDIDFYAQKERKKDEILPWEHIDIGVTKEFLLSENKKAYEGTTTPNCREKCSNCGANKLMGGACNV